MVKDDSSSVDADLAANIQRHVRQATIVPVPNRGRDIWPFLMLLRDGAFRDVDIVPVKDHIAQAQVFTLCVFGLCEGAVLTWRKGRRRGAMGLILLAIAFLANVLYVAPSRTALATIPILLVLFGVLRFGWKGVGGMLILTAALAS